MPITIASALASAILGAPDLIMPILAANEQHAINFTREHEQEADNIGMQLLVDAGFDPQGMLSLFKRMNQQEQYSSKFPEYFRTHPIFETRISEAQNRANSFTYQQYTNSIDYHLIKAKIESKSNRDKQKTLAIFKDRIDKKRYDNEDATLYGYALSLAALHNNNKAFDILNKLAKKYNNNLIIRLSLIDLYIKKKDLQIATQQLEELLNVFPNDSALILKYAEHLIMLKNATKAKKLLLSLIKETRIFEPITYRLLAKAEYMTGNNLEMHRATAEWFFYYGNIKEALTQLDMALKLVKNNDHLKKNIEKRKTEIQKLLDY